MPPEMMGPEPGFLAPSPGTKCRPAHLHSWHLVANGFPRGVVLSTSRFCVEIHLPSFLFLLFWVFVVVVVVQSMHEQIIVVKDENNIKYGFLGPFSLCPSHSSLTRVNHYTSFSDSFYLLYRDTYARQ